MKLKELFWAYLLGIGVMVAGAGFYILGHARLGTIADGAAGTLIAAGGLLIKQIEPMAKKRRMAKAQADGVHGALPTASLTGDQTADLTPKG